MRDIDIALVGRGGGDSPRVYVSFRILIDPNSLGKSDVKVDFWEESGEYGRWPADDVGLTVRGRVGADRPPIFVVAAATMVEGVVGYDGECGVNGGVFVA